MRYVKGHGRETRDHIVEVAARRFREHGVAAAGIAGLMSEAGLTNGAFYSHFESKEQLVQAAITRGIEKRRASLEAAVAGPGGLDLWIRNYLSARHRDDPGSGCGASALVAEIARHPKATRDVFTAGFADLIERVARALPAGDVDIRRRDAMTLYGLLVGTLQLARAISDPVQSDEILANGLDAALAMIGSSRQPSLPRDPAGCESG